MELHDRSNNLFREVVRTARDGLGLGLSVLPPMEDGSKSPSCINIGGTWTWKPFQECPASPEQVDRWYERDHHTGVGLVCGGVSRGLELFEFDDRAAYERFKELAQATGWGPLVDRIEAGYLEDTPGGGVHWFYYCSKVKGSAKLAQRPKEPGEITDADRRAMATAKANGNVFEPKRTLIETKGEGGYAVVAPSFGDVHPTKKPYRLISGGIATIQAITAEERDALWGLARSFDVPMELPTPSRPPRPDPQAPGIPPWEDFNSRATWEEILEPHGWAKVYSRGDTTYWRRPGKDVGVSASTGHAGHDCLYVFTSSTVLKQNKGFDRIGAYVALNHGNDFRAAARALQAKGYGERPRYAGSTNGARPPGLGLTPGDESEPGFAGLSDDDLGIVPLSMVECEPIRWLWKYRLGRGVLAMMAGDGGIGKSQVLLWIGATVTLGSNWVDGSGAAPKGDVIIVSAEDDPENTVKPRLIAMGADIDRVTIVKARFVIRAPGKPPVVHPASFQDRGYWAEVFRRRPGCVLFIADPIPSYLGRGVNDSKNIEIRQILEPFLEEIVRPAGVCMLGNTHLNKTVDSKTPMHRIAGSIAYGALPRNVHFVIRDPDDPMRRLMKQAKCNNAPDDLPALAFRIEQRTIISHRGEEIETAIPVFEAEGVAVDLGTAIGGDSGPAPKNRRGPEPKKTLAVAEALVDFLRKRGGATPLGAIFDHLGETGLIGRKNDKDRWSSGALVYQARDHVPDLPAPRADLAISEMEQPIRAGGRSIVHWYVSDVGTEPVVQPPDPWGPDF